MKKLTALFLSLALAIAMSISLSSSAFADETETTVSETASDETASEESSSLEWPTAPETKSEAALVIEASTGAVLYSENADTAITPASTTKLLTCLIAIERCSLDDVITFSETAVNLEERASSIDAVAGEQMTLEDVLYGLMLPSGNDCANAIAEHISGSISAFAELMNEYAEELGCTSTHFTNPSGLYDSNHYSTASDMYLIAQAAFSNSTLIDIISHTSYTIPATNMSEERVVYTSNYLISTSNTYYNSSVIGGKTGYTDQGGRALVIISEQDDMRLISLFFDCPTYYGVFTDAQSLLDYVYNNFSIVNISQEETRFSYSFDDAKVSMDPTVAIIIPDTMSLSDLDSEIIFASDMDAEEFGDAKLDAGITTQDGNHLYASIEYYYGDTYLGNVYVLINDNLEITSASFTSVIYVNFWYGILAAACVFILMFIFVKIAQVRNRNSKRRAKLKIQRR